MKLTIFQSAQGDCLLVTSRKGKTILVDGGTGSAFSSFIAPLLPSSSHGRLDLVAVSHIDSDHIAGVLQLLEDLIAWRRYDYQSASGNTMFAKPRCPRPPEIDEVWHNGLKDLTGANSGVIQDQLVANLLVLNADVAVIGQELADLAPLVRHVANSIHESLDLSQMVSLGQLGLKVNVEFNGKMILTPEPPSSVPFGDLQVSILGPSSASLEKLRQDWNKWLAANQDVVKEVLQEFATGGGSTDEEELALASMTDALRVTTQLRMTAVELGNRKLVTPPNLASLMFLVREGKKTILMTGDGHWQDILDGLKAQNLLDAEGHMHVTVLKVPHHGSENNLHPDFCRAVSADHYVFCGNGTDGNPNLDILQVILDSRLKEKESPAAAGQSFKFWFSCKPSQAGKPENIAHMKAVMALVNAAAEQSGGRLTIRKPYRLNKIVLQL